MYEVTPDMNSLLEGEEALIQSIRYCTKWWYGDIPYSEDGLRLNPFTPDFSSEIGTPLSSLPVTITYDSDAMRIMNIKVT